MTSNIELVGDIAVVIDLNGHKITADWKDETGVVDVLWAHADENGNAPTVTITGNGAMICGNGGDKVCVVSATDGAKITIENGTFTSGGSACIYATRAGEITIKSGTFSADELYYGVSYLLDVNEAEERGTITVYGGEFVNFDPANHTNDGANNTNKVADGYHSINNNGTYTVSAHTAGTAATCTAAQTCTECSYVFVAALGHKYDAAVTKPDCVNGGYTTYTCSVCGDSYVADEVDALGHDYEAAVTKPDCVNGGYTTYTCSVCGDTYVADEVDALGHD